MPRTITVKGIGKASVKPDPVVFSMNLESRDPDYGKAMQIAARNIDYLDSALEIAGFEKDSVKTVDFNVRTDTDSIKQKDGSYKRVFNGYVIRHDLKLEFDFSPDVLSEALSAIGKCSADPELSIRFTVRDASAVREEVLRNAAENARQKAEILCRTSDAALGDLLTIDYNWGELNVYSHTNYSVDMDCLAESFDDFSDSIDFVPDDINMHDNVTFVWELA